MTRGRGDKDVMQVAKIKGVELEDVRHGGSGR